MSGEASLKGGNGTGSTRYAAAPVVRTIIATGLCRRRRPAAGAQARHTGFARRFSHARSTANASHTSAA